MKGKERIENEQSAFGVLHSNDNNINIFYTIHSTHTIYRVHCTL